MNRIILSVMSALFIFGNVYGQGNYVESSTQQDDYICEGTKWVMQIMSVMPRPDFIPPYEVEIRTYHEWIEGTDIINGKEYMKVWEDKFDDPEYRNFEGYIRKENDKVYYLDKSGEGDEYILFDYSMMRGDKCIFTLIDGYAPTGSSIELTAICMNEGVENNQGHSYEYRTIGFLINGESYHEYFVPIRWIKGIGSQGGILSNMYFGESGGASVYEVYHKGELVYKYQNSAIDNIINDGIKQSHENLKFHLDGSIFKDGDTGICIERGKKRLIE